eukprot:gb/GFBE01059660.1/.p1 GENE.gb/GFBE01059660.1/~~gb/GFBE01059660.1/.p1  ORF type:complete len:367 (+),score=94.27 gb/GFBE01059660.1/:1-1101(+)
MVTLLAQEETPQPLAEAGLALEYQDGGSRLIVRDMSPDGCSIRNRGGEALACLLSSNRNIRSLDIRESNISDNGLAQLCLTLRQTDQLEELHASPVGHTGLEFLLGVVRRCTRLQTLSAEVCDVPTLFAGRQNLLPGDYDTSAYVAQKTGDEEEEPVEDEEEAEAKAAAKAEQLRKLFAENDYDSGDEAAVAAPAAPSPGEGVASSALLKLLSDLVLEVRAHVNLTSVECKGAAVPPDMQLDLTRAAEEHCAQQQRKAAEHEEKGSRTASDALRDQMEEIRTLNHGQELMKIDGHLPGEDGTGSSTRMGIRSYVGRRLFSALGEALFECQRFKSKENQAVSTPEGEMAFIAMYIRQKIAAEAEAGH